MTDSLNITYAAARPGVFHNAQEGCTMPALEEIDRPPPGWFGLDVVRKTSRKWDWVALMVDIDPDDLKNCACEFPALFYVDPNEYRPGVAWPRRASQVWVRVPGKHRNKDAAWDAFQDVLETALH
jgi:hypothetical protein